jgi:hypothetical protein
LKRIFLLRAYGDFIVALQSLIHSSAIASYELIASLHHRPLFEALPASMIPANLPIRFVDFGINGPMLRAFTNRHLLNGATLQELKAVADFCKQNPSLEGGDFIENIHRKWVLELGTGKKFNAIAGASDVYGSYHHFFISTPPSIAFNRSTVKKILILPTARIAKRAIPAKVINTIAATHKDLSVNIAYFKKSENGGSVYSNFSELINLISDADFIYGADSLPIHLSYLLQKPHAIVYPSGVSQQFFTPFALDNAQFFNFNHFN